MNKTPIEWVLNPDNTPGYTSNPMSGCLGPNGIRCNYCYAHILANGRLKPRLLANKQCIGDPNDPFSPRWWKDELSKVYKTKKRCGIFLCSMSDWLGKFTPILWQQEIFDYIKLCDWHRFYILTKNYDGLRKFPVWPDNCYVGGTATDKMSFIDAMGALSGIVARIRFISLEPFLKWQDELVKITGSMMACHMIDWLIIGACTGSKKKIIELSQLYPELTIHKLDGTNKYSLQPKREWVDELIITAKYSGIKVWLKDSLRPTMGDMVKVKEIP